MAFVEHSPFSQGLLNTGRYEQFLTPRKLDFNIDPGDSNCNDNVSDDSVLDVSPPIRPMRTLRLSEKPLTPCTLLLYSKNKPGLLDLKHPRLSEPNLNPFTPKALGTFGRKRCRQDSVSTDSTNRDDANNNNNTIDGDVHDTPIHETIESCNSRPAKRIHLIESNTGLSRYLTEFEEKKLLGTGEFGCVYLCTNRMDGCDYAIKKSNKAITPGSANERRALIEVFAHAVLGKHENVVRYFTAWSEQQHMLIQNEYCNGGSLQDAIDVHRQSNTHFSEREIRQILVHLAEGLRYIHSHKLVHMDIKPSNVFINIEPQTPPLHCSSDDSFEEEDEHVVYKFGDFGHVTSVSGDRPPVTVEEGDARYLAMEVFHDDYSNLTKADIFALGLTVLEAAGGGPLEKNGPEWHALREGNVPEFQHLSKDINDLIRQMLHPDPHRRPSAQEILRHAALQDPNHKTKEQLERELQAARTKSQILEKKIKAYTSLIKNEMMFRDMNHGVRTRSSSTHGRSVGKTANRSHSTTEFGW